MPLTEARRLTFEIGPYNAAPVAASTIIYQGAAVGDNGSGYARPLQAGDPFLGFACHTVNNSAGVAGARTMELLTGERFVWNVTGVTGVGDIGKPVYASDDATFTLTAGSNSYVGRVIRHESGTRCVITFNATRSALAKMTALTDNSGGTASTTIAAIGGTYSQSEVANALASLTASVNAIIARLK